MTDYTKAACAGDWHIFDAVIDHVVGSAGHKRAVAACRAICATCPLLDACLRDHWGNEGVVAGTTWEQRHPRARPITRPSCGTLYGYGTHYKHNEAACGPCRDAKADYKNRRRREQRRKRAS